MEATKEKKLNNYSEPVSLETTEKIIEQMKNCVCKKTQKMAKKVLDFFVKFLFQTLEIYCQY